MSESSDLAQSLAHGRCLAKNCVILLQTYKSKFYEDKWLWCLILQCSQDRKPNFLIEVPCFPYHNYIYPLSYLFCLTHWTYQSASHGQAQSSLGGLSFLCWMLSSCVALKSICVQRRFHCLTHKWFLRPFSFCLLCLYLCFLGITVFNNSKTWKKDILSSNKIFYRSHIIKQLNKWS